MKRTTRIPVKSIPAASGLSSNSSSSRALVFPSTSSNADGDEIKKFCAEGTPSWMSKSNSHTNLSSLSVEDLKEPPQSNPVNNHQGDDSESDSDDQDEQLLQGCIKKAWDAPIATHQGLKHQAAGASIRNPGNSLGQRIAGEGIPTTQANRGLGGITTIPCPTPAASTPHRHGKGIACSTTSSSSSSKPRSSPSATKSTPPPPPKRSGSTLTSNLASKDDEIKIFEVEDTPIDLSEKSSFSDLTVDDPQGSGGRVSVDSNDGLIQHFSSEDQHTNRIGVTPAFRANQLNGAVANVASNSTRSSHSTNESFGSQANELLLLERPDEKYGNLHPVSRISEPETASSSNSYRSNLPRPHISGKSESSSSTSSVKNKCKPFEDYNSSSSSDSDYDNDDLLAKCIRSGMPKSKSEPLDLKNKKLKHSSSSKNISGSGNGQRTRTRSKSKSPRNSKVIPGVRITELKLKPQKSTEDLKTTMTLDFSKKDDQEEDSSAVTWTDESPNINPLPRKVDSIEINPLPRKGDLTEAPIKPVITSSMEDSSLASSICSTLDNIQPPSMMNSLISMSERPSVPNSPKVGHNNRLECRHSVGLSAKKGQKVPEMVRRALDLSSSFSSCQSNLDNIKPPTEMDSSILSIASISSEVADLNNDKKILVDQESSVLDDVAPPTLMEEVSGATKTLVPDDKTYTIDDGNNDMSTCHDITDVFDESQEPTLTLGSDNNADDVIDAPELPRDSSRESTPGTRRKFQNPSTTSLMEREKEFHRLRSYKVSVPSLDEDNSLTSGYKSETPRSPKSFNRRQDDRFKTHTITKSDLDSDSNSSCNNSPGRKTIRQKRQEEAERFRTQTITPSNIIEEEAKNVVEIITESKSSARSRSASADGLLDSRILDQNDLAGSCDSILEQDLLKETIGKAGPKITKPDTHPDDKGIRGRRKGLYSPKKISPPTATSNTKPAIAPKPRNIVPNAGGSKPKLPGSPRGTRSTQLRQMTKTRLNSPPSPKVTPKTSRGRAPLASPAPSTISSSSSTSSSRLVRQGTFTKDEPSVGNKILVDIDVDDKKPPKRPASATQLPRRSPREIVIPQTRTSALRERSRSRQASGSSTTSSNRSIPTRMKTSPSNSSLNNSRLGKRTPTNVEIPRESKVQDVSDTVSESAVTSGKKGGKKEVTSKIASLWKRVEDSKKKDKVLANDKKADKKVWISKGRVIPESDMAYLRPDEAQKKIISDFQKAKEESPIKARSKPRLSMKLPKFNKSSNPLKKENSFTYTSHVQSPRNNSSSVSVPSTPNVEDVVNGNFGNAEKRRSRIGSFVNPTDEKTSAIVPPFNYSPPEKNSTKVVRRNDSYVSSMGRNREEMLRKKANNAANDIVDEDIDEDGAPTSSVLVTLV